MSLENSDQPASPPMLRINGVSVRFGGVVALDEVSFDTARGEICGLIGPNGAGKSTLFNCISRLYTFNKGAIEFEGASLQKLKRHKLASLGIGRTFQNLALFRTMTVRENIELGCHSLHKVGFFQAALKLPGVLRIQAQTTQKVDELLSLLALSGVATQCVANLPFGTQKRVELARALASNPRLLLLDEPACGLNHEELAALGKLIVDIRDKLNVTVLLVEHNMALVMGISDKVVALNFGRKIAEGTPKQVREHPEVLRAYLGVAQ